MLNKLAYIKSKVKLHKRSAFLCLWYMLLCATIIPFVICMAAWIFFDGELPATYRYGQFIIYTIIVGRCWYTCYLRKWSHSYMLDYTQKILDPEIRYCPRCFAPIKISQQDFLYEEKIGEKAIKNRRLNGELETIRVPIMAKRKETLPHLACKERFCGLKAKTQKDSARSEQVRSKLKDNYSFYEMPRTLNKTYRLIAGDRQDSYRSPMAEDMCIGGGFWAPILFLVGIFIVVSLIKDMKDFSNGVYAYLFGSMEALVLYAAMLLLLAVVHIVLQIWVGIKTKAIIASQDFKDNNAYFENLKWDIYMTKRLAEMKTKERKKAMKMARREGAITDNNHTLFSDEQKAQREKAYRTVLLTAIKSVLEGNGYLTESHYYNHCYILHAHSTSTKQPDCAFFITKGNCFLRGSTRFNYGVHQDYIEGKISAALQKNEFSDLNFYVDKDSMCSRISFGILASFAYDIDDLEITATKETISAYLEVMSTIQKSVAPEVLRTVPPELMVIREFNRSPY